ncbi:MAG: FAD-dependent oxidoreductase [Gemmatimonadota bacterium]
MTSRVRSGLLDVSFDMGRRRFLQLGVGGAAAALVGCRTSATRPTPLPSGGRVIVVGAGPAGVTAAYRLRQAGVDVQVLEAAPTHGGRIKHDLDFVDFPLSLGGEWVHVEAEVLQEIVNDPAIAVQTELAAYDPDDLAGYFDGELALGPMGTTPDLKFVGSSWLDFFDTYLFPRISDSVVFNTQVTHVDYSGPLVRLTDADGTTFEADRVIITVPLRILQRGDVAFSPPLPAERVEAIASANVWSGLKAFVEFSDHFYPAVLEIAEGSEEDGQRLYYDAAYGQVTDANVLGLFSVGLHAERYQALLPDRLIGRILEELDEIFDGAASRTYVRHIVQNWNAEPFAGAAYLADDAPWTLTRRLAGAVDGRVVFAGDAYTRFDDWSSVHAAARSAAEAVEELLG